MKTKLFFSCILLCCVIAVPSCKKTNEKHFINDKTYRDQVHRDFLERKEIAAGRAEALFSVMDGSLTTEEREALEFLFAYMPLSDLADYNGEYFLDQVRYSFKARDYFDWGQKIPEDVFRHFVLVYRVNNENLDTARMVIFNEIKDRVKNMNMYDAALEVNHWCHEKVTYRPADSRTSSSLATMKTGYGRCGEESTFTVTAMRAVGIPARQCYTPRWAHTDNNHAWVEVWVDGEWYYLGACEPDAQLNMGWFDIPATRTMMVHSNAFGKYKGDEEINYQTNLFARINMLSNYTNTKKVTVKVIDKDSKPVQDANVIFKLYNHAEYYPIATQKTDAKGEAHLTTGYGDLLIWVSQGDTYGYEQIKVREQGDVTVVLDETKMTEREYADNFDMNPPAPLPVKKKATKEQIDLNNKRIQYEDSIRNAYLATFVTEEDAKKIRNENLTPDQIWHILKTSEGNYDEMIKLMNRYQAKDESLLLNEFFASMSAKDHRDGNAEILNQHITHYNPANYSKEVYLQGIISPRIANEGIRPWRNYLAEKMPGELNNNITPSAVMEWMEKNITIDNDANYFNCPLSPIGVFELRYSDERSVDIFFVAACRSLNIPAYKDLATGQLYAYENGAWIKYPVREEQPKGINGKLTLTYSGSTDTNPLYGYQYTIAKREGGDFNTFEYRYDESMSKFPLTLELEPGYYMLSTGNRYFDGEVLSRLEFFHVNEGKTVSKEIVLRPLEPREMNYGTIDLNYDLNIGEQKSMKIKELVKEKELIVCFIDPTREPTKHLLKDISGFKAQFDKWGGNVLFLIPSDKSISDFDKAKWNLPGKSIVLTDKESSWMNNILTSTQQDFLDNYPLVFIIDKNGTITFKSEGYRIGTGELLFKSLKQ